MWYFHSNLVWILRLFYSEDGENFLGFLWTCHQQYLSDQLTAYILKGYWTCTFLTIGDWSPVCSTKCHTFFTVRHINEIWLIKWRFQIVHVIPEKKRRKRFLSKWPEVCVFGRVLTCCLYWKFLFQQLRSCGAESLMTCANFIPADAHTLPWILAIYLSWFIHFTCRIDWG